jgi:hypothetical protein
MMETLNIRTLSFSTKNLRLLMMISLQWLSCRSGSQSLHVAVKKVGYKVGKFTFEGFGKGRLSGELELLVITPTTVSLEKIFREHQQGQKQ